MKVVVTGGEGFIGSRLVTRLKGLSDDVLTIDVHSGIDICDWNSLQDIGGFDVLYHLAAKIFVPESYEDPRGYYQVNIVGTLNALELCRKSHAKMVFASSYVYGQPKYQPIDENHPRDPFNPYALSKILGEDLCHGYHRDFGINVVIMRPFNIYGEGQDERFLIPSIIKQAKRGYIVLQDPEPRRDWVHVDDVVEAYVLAGRYPGEGFEIYNIGSGRSLSVKEVVEQIIKQIGDDVRVNYLSERRSYEIMDTVADITRAVSVLGWSPSVSFEEGLKRMLR